MRAIIVQRPGQPGSFGLENVPDPRPGAGQVRIRMAGSAINPADLHVMDGLGGTPHPPGRWGVGLDVSGVIDMVASDVRELSIGTPVAALTFPHAPHSAAGAAAEYVIVPAADVAPVPERVDLLDAATVPLNSLTADQLLARLGPADGRRLLVTGAAGGVGGYAVALAALAGWSVTGLARTSDAEFLGRAGADEVITSLEGASAYDAVLDAAKLGGAALRAVRDHGMYAGVFPGLEPAGERGIMITSGVVAPDGRRLREILALTAQGRLETRRAGVQPLEKAALAYQAFREGGRGRWVLTP
ncbi:NADP-dependent oxidoreductase [Streptomyces sp. NBC_00178]|uniref:NADP-dependent oxidoreductase n=1 Tax=Streptomyces sp. NBC_00178 TaxID=2975672 RepID=UPI002E27C378|nr:NADP-dependent oxidoreductase [Streptomyces sp. NBC_00178]